MKVVDSYWFNNTAVVGVVLMEDNDGQQLARIGCVPTPKDKIQDEKYLSEHGVKVPFRIAQGVFPYIRKVKYKDD